MTSKEKLFLKFKWPSQVKSKYKHDFIQARNIFDRLLPRKERQYNKYIFGEFRKISKTDHKTSGKPSTLLVVRKATFQCQYIKWYFII